MLDPMHFTYGFGAPPVVQYVPPKMTIELPPLPPVYSPRGWIQQLVGSTDLAPTSSIKTSSDAFIAYNDKGQPTTNGGKPSSSGGKPSSSETGTRPWVDSTLPPDPGDTLETDPGNITPESKPEMPCIGCEMPPAQPQFQPTMMKRVGLAPIGFVALGVGLIALWAIFK
jgi:hypothetical protein